MDSQDASALPPHFLHHHHHYHHAYPHHHSQPSPPSHPAVLLGTHSQTQQHLPNNSYPLPNSNSSVNPSSTAPANNPFLQQQNPRFPFNNMAAAAPSGPNHPDHMQTDGSTSGGGGGAGAFIVEPARKRRGRPRKYSPDNSIGLGLSPSSVSQISPATVHNDSGGGGGGTPSSDTPAKRNRGRPPGSVKKQLNALGIPGAGFTPHVITVNAGEDVASKIMAFSQQGPRTVCILSANGAICNVTLRQPTTSGGTVTYEGRFDIISLSGSLVVSEDDDNSSRTGGLSVSLAGSEGRVLGGGVAGMLKAASQVQIVVGSFIAEARKPKSGPSSSATHMLNLRSPSTGGSPSPGGSSEENNERPLNLYGGGGNNSIQNMGSMYSNMGWANNMK